MVTELAKDALRLRARRVRLVITDVDGVLTDAGVYYSERGEALKRFSVRDGMGVELLRASGIETAFLSREASECVRKRAEKLALRHVYLGVRDKLAALPMILDAARCELADVAYIADDVNDAEAMRVVAEHSLTAAPWDAVPEMHAICQLRTRACGGHGAFREFADWILQNRREELRTR